MMKADPRNREVLFPYMIGRDLVEDGRPTRWIIDFAQRDTFEARSYKQPFDWVEQHVMPDVLANANAEKKATGKESTRWTRMAERWWQFRDYQPGTMSSIAGIPRYIACSRVTKRPIFGFVCQSVHPDNALIVFPFADDYSFGILQASLHFEWFMARCSTLEGRFRYTSDTIFDSFPWPQSPTKTQIKQVAVESVTLRALRNRLMEKYSHSLRSLYRTLEEPGANPLRDAHTRLDGAVRAAYGMSADDDPLAFLLALNLELAAKEKDGKTITPPGLPLPENERAAFVTDDCIAV